MPMENSTTVRVGFVWGRLTEHVDEGVGQEVPIVVGDVTLVNGAGSGLHISEDDGVVLHLSAGVWWSIWAICFIVY